MTKSCGRRILSAKQIKKDIECLHDTHLVKLGAVSDQLFSVQSLKSSLSRLFEAGELGEVIDDPNYFNNEVCLERDAIDFKKLCGFMESDCFFNLDDGFFHIACKVRFLNSFNVGPEDEIEFIPRVLFDDQGRPKIVAFDVKAYPFFDGITEAVKKNSYGYFYGKNSLIKSDSVYRALTLGYFDKNKFTRIDLDRMLSDLVFRGMRGEPMGEGCRPPTGRTKQRWRTVNPNNSLGHLYRYEINDFNEEVYSVVGTIGLNKDNPLVLKALGRGELIISPRVSNYNDASFFSRLLICFDLIQE